MFKRWRLATLLALGATGLFGCNRTVNTDKGEEVIASLLRDKVGVGPEVACPDDVKAKQGETFTCKATFPGGVTARVEVVQTDDKGNVNFKLVDELLVSKKLEAQIVEGLGSQGIEATADCGQPVRLAKTGASFECKAKAADGQEAVIDVTATDDTGKVDWKIRQPGQ